MSATKQKFIDAVVKGITELPDRSSPEGHPELMQCTAEEVVDVLLVVYREHIAALEADAARYRLAIAKEDNAEALYAAVLSCGPIYEDVCAHFDDAMKGGA